MVITNDQGGMSVLAQSSSHLRGLNTQDVKKITTTPNDSQYLLIVGVEFQDNSSSAGIIIIMKGPLGYLSASEYPLLNFYMVIFNNCINHIF